MERFDAEHYLQLIEKYRVTHSQLVPTMFSRMLKLPEIWICSEIMSKKLRAIGH